MARKVTTREYVMLGVLGVSLVGVLYFGRGRGVGQGADSEAAREYDLGDPPVVRVADLSHTEVDFDASGRSLFKYYTPPPPKRKAPPPPPPQKPQLPKPKPQRVQPQRPRNTTPSKPRPPVISFTYLGYFGPKEAKIAVFEDPEGLLLARAGEVVQEQFRVVDFKFESVVMGYTDPKFETETTELQAKNR